MIDHRIPMMIQTPNLLGAMAQGTENAANQAALMRQAEGQNLFRQYGAGALAGDPAAMNAFASFDPGMAQGLQTGRMEQEATGLRMQLTREQISNARMQAAEAARAQKDAATAAQELQRSRQLMTMAGQAFVTRNPKAWAQVSEEFGVPGLPMDQTGLAFLDAIVSGFDEGLAGLVPQQPEMTAEMRNLEWRAKQAGIKPGTPEYAEFMRLGGSQPRGTTSLSVTPDGAISFSDGVVPQSTTVLDRANLQSGSGQTRVADPTSPTGTRQIAEPGSEAARAEADRERAARAAAENDATRMEVVKKTTDGIRNLLKDKGFWERVVTRDLPEAGIFGRRVRGISQERVDLEGRIDTLQGMVAFDRLEKMKAASATGASGLGQVTEREIALLAAQLGALNADLSPEVIRETLDTVERVFGKLSPQAQAYLLGTSNAEPWTQGGPAAQRGQQPDFLSETDRMIWDVLDEEQRAIILRSYEGQQ